MGCFVRCGAALAAVLLAAVLLPVGTAQGEPAPARVSPGAWTRALLTRRAVSTADVLLAAALLAEEPGWNSDPAWALERARARGWLRRRQSIEAGAPATRGFAAQVFAFALHIKGGVWMRLTGNSARHAYREFKQLGLLPEGGPSVLLTGDELSGLMAGAARYQEVGPERPTVLEWR